MFKINEFRVFSLTLGHDPRTLEQGVASDPLTGSGAYVSGSGGVDASSFTSKNYFTVHIWELVYPRLYDL